MTEAGYDTTDGSGRGGSARAYRIRGRVQGVGFRWWTREMATQLGLRGTVRNCADGTVEIRVAGSVQEVEELADRLHDGPSPARVDAVERLDDDPSISRGRFEIIR